MKEKNRACSLNFNWKLKLEFHGAKDYQGCGIACVQRNGRCHGAYGNVG
ncbi:MAG: hypothetical protein ABSB32_05200 [Thermodesulfobacteriota bacterium]